MNHLVAGKTWFNNNFMKANSDNSQIIFEPSTALIDGSSIESNTKEILLGITIDRDLKFDEHVNNPCEKSCQKLNALVRLAPFMNVDKKCIIMKAFIESQFGYCPLVWMFHSRSLNNKINRIHKRALRITYNDKSSSFQKVLEKDNSTTIHHRNIEILATETYKFLQGLSRPLMNKIFVERNNNYSLRENNVLTRRRVKPVKYSTETDYPRAFLNEIIMNEANYLISHFSSSRRKSSVYIFKVTQGDD